MTGVPCCKSKLKHWLTATCKTRTSNHSSDSTGNPWTMTTTALAVLGNNSLGHYDTPCYIAQHSTMKLDHTTTQHESSTTSTLHAAATTTQQHKLIKVLYSTQAFLPQTSFMPVSCGNLHRRMYHTRLHWQLHLCSSSLSKDVGEPEWEQGTQLQFKHQTTFKS
eukprot:875745-Rhodomonas_salina.5